MSTSSESTWSDQEGLFSGESQSHIPPFRCGHLRAQAPEGLDNVLPVIDPRNSFRFNKRPTTDYVLVALDFEHLCKTKIGRYADGTRYRYNPLTEAGVAYLDMRNVLYKKGRWTMPGDRGHSWFKLMTPLHYIVEEYKGHWGHLCKSDWLHVEPYMFAFGKSKIVKEGELGYRLYRLFMGLRKMNRRRDEIRHNRLREIIFLTFDSSPVENTLSRLGLGWLTEPNIKIWDVQRDMQLELRFNWPKMRFEYVMESLGLRFEDNRFGNLSHCAGNAAVFTIQIFLALFYKDDEQSVAFAAREPMSWLRFTWVGHALDQTNIAPGDSPRRREESQMNRHEVPQKRDENAFH
ncbi:uncharacterized protein NECHADRAFT_85103 [Fusarium vanettenii 77-13-4]|uniref:Gfd2/YDR514C-like C-terminal domain-containing protein n=1 Tax=Fusarium vanettenii (strain ATCC MYA-4622 / CBS 123669 / FGSC 9596 / NRRL 45880 / 77-13-4) TaxID=660122 RepID=C7YV02_FUSV7|nr:uncharacterized protein NECHADRAFT_85103 [Fusarium vanettenii 77-13-4]EEU44496.1 hypothetical protein NECHADRAFT_85103 [Fusarium vanettenii 77-13-4]